MIQYRRARRALGLVAALGLTAAACGSDDDGASAPADSTPADSVDDAHDDHGAASAFKRSGVLS